MEAGNPSAIAPTSSSQIRKTRINRSNAAILSRTQFESRQPGVLASNRRTTLVQEVKSARQAIGRQRGEQIKRLEGPNCPRQRMSKGRSCKRGRRARNNNMDAIHRVQLNADQHRKVGQAAITTLAAELTPERLNQEANQKQKSQATRRMEPQNN